jgi:hypothetical protein
MSPVRVTFLAAGAISLLFGLFFLLGAGNAIESYNLGAPTIPALLFARATGATLVGIGIANLLAAADPGSPALKALAIANLAIHLLSLWVDFSETYEHSAGIWVGLAVHVIFIAAFGYLLVQWGSLTRPMRQP